MDPITIDKFQARKMYKTKRNQFLSSFILHCFTALVTCILCSSPYWLPPLHSSIKAFLFVYLPRAGILFFNPKYLFIICNVIVIFLIGESKFVSSNSNSNSNSSPSTDMYDEYVARSASLRRQSSVEEKKVEEPKLELSLVHASETVNIVEEEEELKEVKGDGGGESQIECLEEEVEEDCDGEEEEEVGLPTEELNKRVEDFIARFNKQRVLEARMMCLAA